MRKYTREYLLPQILASHAKKQQNVQICPGDGVPSQDSSLAAVHASLAPSSFALPPKYICTDATAHVSLDVREYNFSISTAGSLFNPRFFAHLFR